MLVRSGRGSIAGDLYQAGITESVVTHDPTTGGISFCAGFENPPMLFAAMATHHGSDSAEVRLASGISPTGAQVFIEEESCSDDEVEHVAEVVAFLALERGPHKIRAMTHEASCGTACYGASDPRTCDNEPPSNAMCCQDMLDRTCQECWSRQRQPPATGQSCTDRATTTFNEMNDVCCPSKGCTDGTFPRSCDADCAGLWMPIW